MRLGKSSIYPIKVWNFKKKPAGKRMKYKIWELGEGTGIWVIEDFSFPKGMCCFDSHSQAQGALFEDFSGE